MKARSRPSLRIATTLALALAWGGSLACEPADRRPGLWLSGEVVTDVVEDWSFTVGFTEIFVETRTWYGIPHSVTTVCAAAGPNLYVPSVYYEGGSFPEARFWNRNVVRDPAVRLKIGDRIFARRAVLVTDPAERETALAAFASKYPFWKEIAGKPAAERVSFALLRMAPPERPDGE